MSVQDLGISLDTVWMLLAAMLVFFMQPGFALCEAGFTRSKNTANILFKNFVDFMVGSVLFWFVGFGFMFGSDGAGFIGCLTGAICLSIQMPPVFLQRVS